MSDDAGIIAGSCKESEGLAASALSESELDTRVSMSEEEGEENVGEEEGNDEGTGEKEENNGHYEDEVKNGYDDGKEVEEEDDNELEFHSSISRKGVREEEETLTGVLEIMHEREVKTEERYLWCVQCCVALCKQHAFAHVIEEYGHSITDICASKANSTTGMKSNEQLQCPANESLGECKCCVSLEKHDRSNPPRYPLCDLAEWRRKRVFARVERLELDSLPRVKAALKAVRARRTYLSAFNENVKSDICAAGSRVRHDMHVHASQSREEADTIVQHRFKTLAQQKKEVNRLLELAMSTFRNVGQKLGETQTLSKWLVHTECTSLDMQLTEVTEKSGELFEHPKANSLLGYKPLSETLVAKRVESQIGRLLKCSFSESHTVSVSIQGMHESVVPAGETVELTVEPRNKNGTRLVELRFVTMHLEWLDGPDAPPVKLTAWRNGRYWFSTTLVEEGEYVLAAVVNGVCMPQPINITCQAHT